MIPANLPDAVLAGDYFLSGGRAWYRPTQTACAVTCWPDGRISIVRCWSDPYKGQSEDVETRAVQS